MGSNVSTNRCSPCCSIDNEYNESSGTPAPDQTKQNPPPPSNKTPVEEQQQQQLDPEMKQVFRKRLEDGLDVNLILQDKTKLTCQVRLDKSNEFVLLSCDKKVRAIGMRDIKAILYTQEHLKRVESSAGITDIDTCAAIHLAASGNCIPLFFTNGGDKKYFVALMEQALDVSNNNTTTTTHS